MRHGNALPTPRVRMCTFVWTRVRTSDARAAYTRACDSYATGVRRESITNVDEGGVHIAYAITEMVDEI